MCLLEVGKFGKKTRRKKETNKNVVSKTLQGFGELILREMNNVFSDLLDYLLLGNIICLIVYK